MADDPRVRLDLAARTATLGGLPARLPKLQFDLLAYLAAHAGRVIAHDELRDGVWGDEWRSGRSVRTIHMHISWLRRFIGDDAAKPRYIHSLRGLGIRLERGVVELTGQPEPAELASVTAVRGLCQQAMSGVEAGWVPAEVGKFATQVLAALEPAPEAANE